MTAWHLPLALSGQDANLPQGSLTFRPKLAAASWVLPFFLPGVMGTVSRAGATSEYTLAVKIGSLKLSHLAVGASVHPGAEVALAPGQSTTWK